MKHRNSGAFWGVMLCAALLVGCAGRGEKPGAGGAPDHTMPPAVTSEQPGQGGAETPETGEDKAREIALGYVGVAQEDAAYVRVERDWENGREVFEVEFFAGEWEYGLEIEAGTGEIRAFDSEREPGTASPGGEAVDRARAGELALELAGVTREETSFLRAEPDDEDGRSIFDVRFATAAVEYDCEIDASSGAVLAYGWELR